MARASFELEGANDHLSIDLLEVFRARASNELAMAG
jgi:hypothetical protein